MACVQFWYCTTNSVPETSCCFVLCAFLLVVDDRAALQRQSAVVFGLASPGNSLYYYPISSSQLRDRGHHGKPFKETGYGCYEAVSILSSFHVKTQVYASLSSIVSGVNSTRGQLDFVSACFHATTRSLTHFASTRMMSDWKVELVEDNISEFYVEFYGPKDSKLSPAAW